jgi:hypothetical protein
MGREIESNFNYVPAGEGSALFGDNGETGVRGNLRFGVLHSGEEHLSRNVSTDLVALQPRVAKDSRPRWAACPEVQQKNSPVLKMHLAVRDDYTGQE